MLMPLSLLMLALILNRGDCRMLLLTIIVGLSYFLPVSYITKDPLQWYGICIGTELVVMLSAYFMKTSATTAIMTVCSIMILAHINSFAMYHVSLADATYVYIINYLEYIEIIVCALFSKRILDRIKEGVRRCHLPKC